MRILFLLSVSFLLTVCCFAQNSKQLSGHLDGLNTDSIVITVIDKDFAALDYRETIPAPNGNFVFNLKGTDGLMVNISPKPEPGKHLDNVPFINFIMNPNENGLLNGSFEDYTFCGSPYYNVLGEFFTEQNKVNREMGILADKAEKARKESSSEEEIAELTKQQNQLMMDFRKWGIELVKKHSDEDVAAALLRKLGAANVMPLLTEKVKTGPLKLFVKACQLSIDQQKARRSAMNSVAPGNMAPDFTLKDLNDKDLTLSNLCGKYVVLDFWGSWCGWCIKGFPTMKVYYGQYKDKLEIVGVDCNDNIKAWKDAVAKHELPWKHVYNPKSEKDITTVYAVSGFPTKVLIDPQGKIIRTFVGESPDFYNYLDELFKTQDSN